MPVNGVKDDVKFCEWLAQYVGVAAVPGSSFFREDVNNLIRFHFAKQDDTLNEAINRLAGLRKAVAEAVNVEQRIIINNVTNCFMTIPFMFVVLFFKQHLIFSSLYI